MHDRRIWSIALAAILTLVITTGYVSARVKSQAASQLAGEDADDVVTFRVRIQNISADNDLPTLFAPGVWVLHSEAGPLFASGERDRGEGLEALAEDGEPTKLAAALRAQGLHAGIFNTPVCADTPGPLPSRDTVEFGNTYEFEVVASPEAPYLSFATMLVHSNDLFLAPPEKGIALFNVNGAAIGVQEVTAELLLWDAGTEANEEPGVGTNQAPRQPAANTGPADEMATVRPVDDGFSYPSVADLVRVYIVQVPMVERGRGASQSPSPDHAIGETLRVGDVQWRVLSAENLGHELSANKNRQTTDERFIQVRFQFLNVGSDPLEFEAVRTYLCGIARDVCMYIIEFQALLGEEYPKDFIEDDEECFGRRVFGPWRPFMLKPNISTSCATIFEVKVDSTDLVVLLSGLQPQGGSVRESVGLEIPSTPRKAVGKVLQVGDVRWQVLSVETTAM